MVGFCPRGPSGGSPNQTSVAASGGVTISDRAGCSTHRVAGMGTMAFGPQSTSSLGELCGHVRLSRLRPKSGLNRDLKGRNLNWLVR